jgi:hypothetical protein
MFTLPPYCLRLHTFLLHGCLATVVNSGMYYSNTGTWQNGPYACTTALQFPNGKFGTTPSANRMFEFVLKLTRASVHCITDYKCVTALRVKNTNLEAGKSAWGLIHIVYMKTRPIKLSLRVKERKPVREERAGILLGIRK